MAYQIQTPCGPIQGTDCSLDGVIAYKGIRYAVAGRWEYPKVVAGWQGVYDATRFGSCCWQSDAFRTEEELQKGFYHNEFRKDLAVTYSEDCLFLNIWTPASARPGAKLPVLVYIHGGAFQGGHGHEKPFVDPVWPTRGVIAVTLNYRVGPLGFACFDADGHRGNYGLYDQVAALQWLRKNISAFGGDPGKITLMGQSAGAMSVQYLCLSPMVEGMFSRAVMVSGGGALKCFGLTPAKKQRAFWKKVMAKAGCEDPEQLKALDVKELFAAWEGCRKGRLLWNGCSPCVDDKLIVDDPIELIRDGLYPNMPYMIGTTGRDMVRLPLAKAARRYCAEQARQGRRSSFVWFFDRKLPGDKKGAWHSSDPWYWFGTLANCWRPMTDKDRELSDQMVSYLTNFARCGDPNGSPLPMWEASRPTSRRVLHLGEKPTRMAPVNGLRLRLSSIFHKVP